MYINLHRLYREGARCGVDRDRGALGGGCAHRGESRAVERENL